MYSDGAHSAFILPIHMLYYDVFDYNDIKKKQYSLYNNKAIRVAIVRYVCYSLFCPLGTLEEIVVPARQCCDARAFSSHVNVMCLLSL